MKTVKMTKRIFDAGMGRLEQMFNQGVQIKENVRTEYFTAFCYEKPRVFDDAVQFVIESFKPFPSEPFPSVATLKIASLRVVEEDEEESKTEEFKPDNVLNKSFCEKCRNSGLYLDYINTAHFCDCEKGRFRQAAWGAGTGDRKRQEKIQKALEKLPPAEPPHHGLKEWNPAGFWEDTQEQHDAWMKAKRAEIDEIDARRARARESSTEGKKSGPTGLLGAVKGVLAQLSEARQSIKELEIDPEAPL